jgi:hypothetical protein
MQRFLTTTSRLAAWLILPLALLLFAQWPLRDWLQAYSRQANDMGQILFALVAAVSVGAASAAGTHLAAHSAVTFDSSSPTQPSPWRAWALAACILPWSLWMLATSAAPVWDAVLHLERFGETNTPGFFLVKLAGFLLYLLTNVTVMWSLLATKTITSKQ